MGARLLLGDRSMEDRRGGHRVVFTGSARFLGGALGAHELASSRRSTFSSTGARRATFPAGILWKGERRFLHVARRPLVVRYAVRRSLP